MRRGTLREALRATGRIPRLTVGPQAVGVGADRLAVATGLPGQRLAIGAELGRLRGLRRIAGRPGLARHEGQGLAVGAKARTARAAIATTEATIVAARATGTTTTTEAAIVAARPTGATAAARTTTTAGATRATRAIATGATATTRTTTALAHVARRRRELPADARGGHLATRRAIVVVLALFLGLAVHEAGEAARFVLLVATEHAATTAATATATAAAAATTAAIATAAAAIVAALLLAADAVDDVVELAARRGAVRAGLALVHAHEADLVDVATDDIERLEQALGALGLDADRRGDGLDRRIGGLRRLARLGGGLATLGRRRGLGGGLGALDRGRRLGDHGGRALRRSRAGGSCLPQRERRELGERLHGGLATPFWGADASR